MICNQKSLSPCLLHSILRPAGLAIVCIAMLGQQVALAQNTGIAQVASELLQTNAQNTVNAAKESGITNQTNSPETFPSLSVRSPEVKNPHKLAVVYSNESPKGSLKEVPFEIGIVRRQDTGKQVASQVFLSVAVSLLAGGVVAGGAGFSKTQLKAKPIEDAKDRVKLRNPMINNLPAQMQVELDKWLATQERFKGVEFTKPITLGAASARLIYENLMGDAPETFKLVGQATIYKEKEKTSFFSGKYSGQTECEYASEKDLPIEQWAANDYALVQEEAKKMEQQCLQTFISWLPKLATD